MSRNSVPDLTKGVRQPATIATRPPGPASSWRAARGSGGAPPGRVQTVSARSRISSSAVASLAGGSGGGGARVGPDRFGHGASIGGRLVIGPAARWPAGGDAALRRSPGPLIPRARRPRPPAHSSGTATVTTPRSARKPARRPASSPGRWRRRCGGGGAGGGAGAAEEGTAAVVGRQPVEQGLALGAAAGEDRGADPDRGGRQVLGLRLRGPGRRRRAAPRPTGRAGWVGRAAGSATRTSRPRRGAIWRSRFSAAAISSACPISGRLDAVGGDDDRAGVAGAGRRSERRSGDLAIPGSRRRRGRGRQAEDRADRLLRARAVARPRPASSGHRARSARQVAAAASAPAGRARPAAASTPGRPPGGRGRGDGVGVRAGRQKPTRCPGAMPAAGGRPAQPSAASASTAAATAPTSASASPPPRRKNSHGCSAAAGGRRRRRGRRAARARRGQPATFLQGREPSSLR